MMMTHIRRLVGTAGVVSMMASGALAEGLDGTPSDRECPAARFKGFYVGAHGGFASFTSHQNDLDVRLFDGSYTASDNSGIAGLQVGYNVVRCHALVGIEADLSWGSLDADTRAFPNNEDFATRYITSINGLGTLRARAGLALDNLLLYATGGLAFADSETKIQQTVNFGGDVGFKTELFSFSDKRIGWTAGVGTEWALLSNVRLKTEVLYMSFGDNNHTATSQFLGGLDMAFRTDDSAWVGRLGLSIKLGN